MIVMFWLLSRMSKLTIKNITFMIWKVFFAHYHLHLLLAFCEYIWMQSTKVAFKDKFKPTFLVFKKTTFVTFLHATWCFSWTMLRLFCGYVRYASKNKHQSYMCLKKDPTTWSKYVDCYDLTHHIMSIRIFTLNANEVFISTPIVSKEKWLQPQIGFVNHLVTIMCYIS